MPSLPVFCSCWFPFIDSLIISISLYRYCYNHSRFLQIFWWKKWISIIEKFENDDEICWKSILYRILNDGYNGQIIIGIELNLTIFFCFFRVLLILMRDIFLSFFTMKKNIHCKSQVGWWKPKKQKQNKKKIKRKMIVIANTVDEHWTKTKQKKRQQKEKIKSQIKWKSLSFSYSGPVSLFGHFYFVCSNNKHRSILILKVLILFFSSSFTIFRIYYLLFVVVFVLCLFRSIQNKRKFFCFIPKERERENTKCMKLLDWFIQYVWDSTQF